MLERDLSQTTVASFFSSIGSLAQADAISVGEAFAGSVASAIGVGGAQGINAAGNRAYGTAIGVSTAIAYRALREDEIDPRYIATAAGRQFLATGARAFVATADARSFLATGAGRQFLATAAGRAFLATAAGRDFTAENP